MARKHVDIKNWREKIGNCKRIEAAIVKEVTDWGMDTLHKKTVANVSGDRYGFKRYISKRTGKDMEVPIRGAMTNAGHLPVPVVYGWLRRSIKQVRVTHTLGAVFADTRVAHYAKFVHDGTRKMRPRRFLGDAVTGLRPIIFQKFKKEILKAIGKVGRT